MEYIALVIGVSCFRWFVETKVFGLKYDSLGTVNLFTGMNSLDRSQSTSHVFTGKSSIE